MHTEEQQLIDGLFSRLKEAERQTNLRDQQAETHIQQRLREQPSAPYYMAQVILIQEATLKQLDQRARDLEAKLSQLQQSQQNQNRPSSGGFLSGLFGGTSSPAPSVPAAPPVQGRGWSEPGLVSAQPPFGSANVRSGWGQNNAGSSQGGSGFLAGAMQTAVGVAGGVLLAETISGLFHDSKPEELAAALQPEAIAPVAPEATHFNPVDDFQQTDYDNPDNEGFFDEEDDETFV